MKYRYKCAAITRTGLECEKSAGVIKYLVYEALAKDWGCKAWPVQVIATHLYTNTEQHVSRNQNLSGLPYSEQSRIAQNMEHKQQLTNHMVHYSMVKNGGVQNCMV